jgi:hypothetical protein
VITLEDGRLVARAGVDGALHVELEHWHLDTFRSRCLDPDAGALQASSRVMATLTLDVRGEARGVPRRPR